MVSATDQEILEAIAQGRSQRDIQRNLRVGTPRLTRLLRKHRKEVAQAVQEPTDDVVPTGFHITRVCKHTKNGESVQEWTHSSPSKELMFQAQINALEALITGLPAFDPIDPPDNLALQNLSTTYIITDLHLGMYAWENEGSEQWDINRAEKVFKNAITDMLQGSPNSEEGVLAFLGDLCHWDGLLQETIHSRHNLDGSCRFGQLTETALDCILFTVRSALEKHQRVRVVIAEGNHDESSAQWLNTCLPVMFRDNPRVSFLPSGLPYYAFLHGDHMIAFHHGHKCKDKAIAGVFSADPKFREMWGKAKQTWVHTGHLHHQSVIEVDGAIVERHPTLSARDSYAARAGYQSWKCANSITYDKKLGPIMRVTVTPRL